MKKQITAQATLVALALAPGQSQALGFGRVISDTVLGQPLSFTVPVHVEPGERLGEDCVHTLVFFGDGQLPANLVQTTVERGAGEGDYRVHVATRGPVNEPVVDVSLEAGCVRPFARKFTVFADPPSTPWTAQLAQAEAAQAAPVEQAWTARGGSPSAARGGSAKSAMGRSSSSSSGQRSVLRKGPTVALADAVATRAAAPRHRGPLATPAPATAVAPGRNPALRPPAAEPSARLELSAGFGGPRLRMDIDDPVIPVQDPAATAALSQQVEGDTEQLENLRRNMANLRRDSQTGRAQTARLQAALEDAEARNQWLPWIAGLFGLTLAAALILVWRLRRQSRLAERRWYEESQLFAPAAPDSEPPSSSFETPPAPRPATPAGLAHAVEESAPELFVAESAAEPGGAVVQDAMLPAVAIATVAVAAPVKTTAKSFMSAPADAPAAPAAVESTASVEDLLDIEQQADFFVALGQEDAAVDLLTSHIRAAGMMSPLPYAKLLELHQRLDEPEAYERVRERFQRRFGAPAPDWEAGPAAGHALDDYAEPVTRLQVVWKAPADAQVLLQSLLFRRDPAEPLLDLPAYRDVLMLFSVARDLTQHPAIEVPELVDVFLPIGDVASAVAAATADSVHAGSDDLPAHAATLPPTTFDMPEFDPGTRTTEFGEVDATLDLSPVDFDVTGSDDATVTHDAEEKGKSGGH